MDEARFDRQRRNVLLTSTIIIGVDVTGADFTQFKLFGLSPTNSIAMMVVLLVVMLYFILRFHQMHDADVKKQKSDITDCWINYGFELEAKRQAELDAKEHHREILRREDAKDIQLVVKTMDRQKGIEIPIYRVYKVRWSLNWMQGNAQGGTSQAGQTTVEFTYPERKFIYAKLRGMYALWVHSKFVTEYYLPYALGCFAALTIIYRIVKLFLQG
jgi:hypothetical protein